MTTKDPTANKLSENFLTADVKMLTHHNASNNIPE